MNNVARVFATGIIWGALTILGVAMTVSHVDISGFTLTFVMTALIVGATIGTAAVWHNNGANTSAQDEAEKLKRRSRVERLMNDLDEHDLDELRFRLMGDANDESVPLEELMQTGRRR